jgi:hypothetical protein
MSKEAYDKEREEVFKIRDELFDFLDRSLPQKPNSQAYDFAAQPKLDAKELYEIFYKYDYQIRKTLALGAKLAR